MYAHSAELMNQKYNCPVRQSRVKNVLSQMRLCNKLGEIQDEAETLAKGHKTINKLSPQVPVSHRGNKDRIQFLRNAVLGYEWTAEPLSRIESQDLLFQQLYSEIEATVQLSKEGKIASMRDSMGPTRNQTDQDESKIAGILYANQGKYAFRNKGTSKRVNPKRNDILTAAIHRIC